MTLQYIGAGFGRTGTLSVFTALNQLGLPCYHMTEIWKPQNKEHLKFWHEVANSPPGTQHDWDRAFKDYVASVDNPGCCVWRELMAAYPEAKVILTVHPKGPEAWYESTYSTVYYATEKMWHFRFLSYVMPAGRRYADMARKLIWQRSHKGHMDDRAQAIADYKAHIEEVKATVPPEKLLICSAADGWEPLCRFVDKPVPEGPFPNVNDRAAIKKELHNVELLAYIVLGFMGIVSAGAAYGIAHSFF